MRYLLPLLLTSCLSASTGHGSFAVRSTQESHEVGKDGQVMLSNIPRAVAAHCEDIKDCYEQIRVMCGGSFSTIREQWLIGNGLEQPNNHFNYKLYGLYFVLGECK